MGNNYGSVAIMALFVAAALAPGLVVGAIMFGQGDPGGGLLAALGWFGVLGLWSQSARLPKEPTSAVNAGRRRWGAFLALVAALFVFRPAPDGAMGAVWLFGLAVAVAYPARAVIRSLREGPGSTEGDAQRPRSGVRAPRYLYGQGWPDASTKHPRGRSPVRFDVDELARRLGVKADELRAAKPAYARFTIPKRSGGAREIVAPDPATKALQRRILHRILARLPVHPACHGFERGRSIVSNASPHAGRQVVIRLDIREFFRSTSARRVRRFYRVLGWNREAAAILTRLTTLDGGLPQGAPTSPRLANLVNIQLDARLDGITATFLATYTRYADDLTFSFEDEGHGLVGPVIRATRRFLRQTGYELHEGRKLRIRRRHQRQLVTGLVVNSRVALPRSRRRWLRAVEHHIRTGRPATLTEAQLKGWHGYELMIERAALPAAGSEES